MTRHRSLWWTFALGAVLAPTACHANESPDDAFRLFTAAVLSHQPDAAWARLSKESQEAMTAATARVAALSPKGTIPKDPKALLFGEDVGLAQPIEKIDVLEKRDDLARLDVTAGGARHEVFMVREGGRWKLDLTHGLKL
ncbi:MAG: hypothetical protein ACYCWW_18715 [Deltaproteobacteria bacterium]